MSQSTWRTFNFFECTPIRDPNFGSDNPLYSDPNLTEICTGPDSLFFATVKGDICQVSRELQLVSRFQAEENPQSRITHIRYLEKHNLLLTIHELQGHPVTVCLFNLEKSPPSLHASLRVQNGHNTFPVSAFDISDDCSVLAFGFADGSVYISRGDIIHDRGSRQRHVYKSSSPVTNVAFVGSELLYVTLINKVLTIATHGRNNFKAESILDKQHGAAVGCAVIDASKRLVVAREVGISYYDAKLLQLSLVFDIPKRKIFVSGQYLLIVAPGSASALDAFIPDSSYDSTRILILDTVHKYVAFAHHIPRAVNHIFYLWGSFHLLDSDGTLYSLTEKSLSTRLEILKSRSLYDVALQIATPELRRTIEKEYADLLFSENEPQEALPHYIAAIGLGSTSEVLLKYRDSQLISCLAEYLEAIHDAGLASPEHTTLLLNSYAKLKDRAKLEQFMTSKRLVDFHSAVQILIQSGFYDLAVNVCKSFGEPDQAVEILLKQLKDAKACLQYVKSLPVTDCLRILIQNSRDLLNIYPNETTALLISLFTGRYSPSESERESSNQETVETQSQTASNNTQPVMQSYKAFLAYMYRDRDNASTNSGVNGGENGTLPHEDDESIELTYQPPRARLIFPSFVNHTNEFVIFLEACVESYDKFGNNRKDKTDLVATLFEMYLTLANSAETDNEKRAWDSKAKDLVNSSGDILDRNTILLLSHVSSHSDGWKLVKDQQGYQLDFLRSCIANGDTKGALSVISEYDGTDKEFYAMCLSFFISSSSILEEVGDNLDLLLQQIKKEKIMTPIEVVQILSSNSVATIRHVRSFLTDIIKQEEAEIENNTKLAESYLQEATVKKAHVDTLLSDPQVIQYSQCASCGMHLDLPVVHFSCKHSYHHRCLNIVNEEEPECPRCMPELEAIQAIRRAQDDTAERSELFHSALESSDTKFRVVADFFGRGAIKS